MSSLDSLLSPSSIAIIGASSDSETLSGRPLRILREYGYEGDLYPVNLHHEEVQGTRAYLSIATIPSTVAVALIVVPAAQVLAVIEQCADCGVGFAVIMSSGFAEQDEAGAELERRLVSIAAKSGMRVLGPNAEGFLNAKDRVAATFSPAVSTDPPPSLPSSDGVAVVSQSGGLGFALLQRGAGVGLGIDHVVTTGNEADLELTDFLGHFASNSATKVILVIAEGIRDPRRFEALALTARRNGKSIIIAKLGRTEPGGRAALSHTAHIVGRDDDNEELFHRGGVLRAADDEELVDMAMALARTTATIGKRLGIVTTSGGAGALLADVCETMGLAIPRLSDALQDSLRLLIPLFGTPQNPVDVTAQTITTGGLVGVIELMLASAEVDGIALACSLASSAVLQREGQDIAGLVREAQKPFVLYSYTSPSRQNIELMAKLRLPWFPSASRTGNAIRVLFRQPGVL